MSLSAVLVGAGVVATYTVVATQARKKNNASGFPLPAKLEMLLDKIGLRRAQTPDASSEDTHTETEEITPAEREINHYLAVTATSLAVATYGTLFSPLLVPLALPGLVYTAVPIWREAHHALVKERRFKMACVDAVAMPAAIISGYFVAASLGYTLYFVGKKLLLKTQDHSKAKLINILGEQPRSVWIAADGGGEVEIPFEQLQAGHTLIVQAGEMIPIDGLIIEGQASIDQRMLTGEAQPAEKTVGEKVFAATVVLQGKVQVQVETTGNETIAAQIGTILQQTTDFKSMVQLKGEQFGDRMALPLIALTALAYTTVGPTGAIAILHAPLVNTVRLASPLSISSFLQLALDQGILIKDGRSLELLQDIDTVVFDKTGTLTQEQPTVGALHPCDPYSEDELLRLAAAAEHRQTHPIAKAIVAEAQSRQLTLPHIEEAKYEVGYGLAVKIDQQLVQVGSQRFMTLSHVVLPTEMYCIQAQCSARGHSLVYVALDGTLVGAIELHPTIRPEAKQIIEALRERGLTTYIISGDHEEPTRLLAQNLQIDHYFAETLPEDKASLIAQLQDEGRAVCFVGDGINDSIALKKANVPISLSGAAGIATDTAQIIMMDGSLKQLLPLIDLATRLDDNMRRNVLAAAIPSALCIGGAFVLHLGVYGAIGLYNASLFTGILNAISPSLSNGQQQPIGDHDQTIAQPR